MNYYNQYTREQQDILNHKIIDEYKQVACQMIHLAMPQLYLSEIEEAVNYSILKRMKNANAYIDNNYKDVKIDITLLELSEYIITREPIITPYGVMFKKHTEVVNPIAKLLEKFMKSRKEYKDEMFKHPKGSEEFEKYNLLQLLAKIDANGFYGAIGQYSCLYYNINVAASVTTQGRSLISSAGLQFEMFLANNCKFGSLDEVVTFIYNIINEKEERQYRDIDFIDKNISMGQCFYKVILTCGFNYIPSTEDLEIVWDIMCSLSQEDINRIYYKNNLYEFMENTAMQKALKYLLVNLKTPFLDPNHAPEEIKAELLEFRDILMEFVYYHHQVLDRLDKYDNMYRSICIITDTDSTIISLDGWYRYGLNIVKDVDMPIKYQLTDLFTKLNIDEFGDRDAEPLFEKVEPPKDFSFYSDEVMELERSLDIFKIIPQDGLRYSIINILAFCLGHIINDYMIRYTMNSNSYSSDKICLISMKNEFLFKRVLLTEAKKNYATIQEIQEGNIVKKDKQLDIKGLVLDKSVLTNNTRKRLKNIVYEQILNCEEIDQVAVLKELAKFEKDIFNSIRSGSKEYYKPSKIKSISSYDDPMRQQGIKASIAYNVVRDKDMEPIDLEERVSIDIIKVDINPKNIDHLKIEHNELYNKLIELFDQKDFKKGITAVAMPKNENVPEWLLDFVDYHTIISDNVKHLPIESLGLYRGRNNVNYTNIIKLV